MKTKKYMYLKNTFLLMLVLLISVSCERNLSDDAEFATYPSTGGIFSDNFVGGLDYFPFGGSFAEAFSVDNNEKFLGTASMRFDIPVFGTGYGGATFPSLGPRDLTSFDALTFWAKASQGADINEIGFGINGDANNKFQVTLRDLPLTTNWKKYTIPIPDPSKLNQAIGMFWYAEGAENPSDEGGYTFWIDELQFENLGNVAQPRPSILNGEDREVQTFNGSTIQISGTQTFNLASGEDITTSVAPSYFSFESSNTGVAIVNELGQVTIIGQGIAEITATLAGVVASGSLTLNSVGSFDNAPDPTLPQADVLSIFSDTYTGVADFNPGAFAGSNTGNIQIQDLGGNNNISYESIDFIGMEWNGTEDVSGFTNVHLDVQLLSSGGSSLTMELIDFGPDDMDNGFANSGNDGTAGGFNISSQLNTGNWVSLDIPLNSFTQATGGGGTGSPNLNNLGYIVFVSSDGATFLVDNIYFY